MATRLNQSMRHSFSPKLPLCWKQIVVTFGCGSASRSGPNAYNMELSKRRVRNIASVLRARGIFDRQTQLEAIGEEEAQTHALEEEKDRAVELIVLPVAKESPPPPKKIPPPPPVSAEFKVRLLGGLSGSAGPYQTEQNFFQIADIKNNRTAFYTYTSMGVGRGFIPRVPISVTMKGPWNAFRTTAEIRVSQFEGAARFTTAGAGPWTSNHLNMMGLPPGVSTIPRVLPIDTGFTIGAGASTSVGKMTWIPREEMIYNGD